MSKGKVLIVDDEPYMQRLIEFSLKKSGYEFDSAMNGLEALTKTDQFRPDLIVMDVAMPEMDGLEALEKLKQNEKTKNIPVIMLTAKGQLITRQEAEKYGASIFLTKPFSPSELLSQVSLFILQYQQLKTDSQSEWFF